MPDKNPTTIRAARAADSDALIALWHRSVAATHQFLAPGEIEALAPLVRSQVVERLETWVLEQQSRAVGFMALDGSMVEALFLDPTHFRQGGGRQLLDHARTLKGALRVDVNEQNVDALRFYLAAGFEIAGRSDVDQAGRPYPLLHLQESNGVSFAAAASRHGPDPKDKHPMAGFPQVCFIRNTVTNPNIVVGEYTYYDDPDDSEGFERNVLYHYPFTGDKLVIGRFCAIARGVKFIMNGANHKMSGFSTYPFQIFGHGWEHAMPSPEEFPYKGDTRIGNDVWIGYDSLVMPGVQVGNGAIISARSVVVSDVPAYTIVGGNPARPLRTRFAPEVVAELEALAWWDWPVERITQHLCAIMGANLAELRAAAEGIRGRMESASGAGTGIKGCLRPV